MFLLLQKSNETQLLADLVASVDLGVFGQTQLLGVKDALERAQDVVRGNVQEEGGRDAPQGAVVGLVGNHTGSGLVDNDLVVSGLDNTASQPLELLAGLDLDC